jgi:hypothetical protein
MAGTLWVIANHFIRSHPLIVVGAGQVLYVGTMKMMKSEN